MPFGVESSDEADAELLVLPPAIREGFVAAFRELAVAEPPFTSGPGWYTEELRQRQRVAPEGLRSLHVAGPWRGAFFRRGASPVLIGFGFRLPEFYERLRAALIERLPSGKGLPK